MTALERPNSRRCAFPLRYAWKIPQKPESVGAAREQLREVLEGRDWPTDLIEDATLVASELVTNAIVHGAAPIELIVEVQPGSLQVGVQDASPAGLDITVDAQADLDRDGGRGLWIVTAMADACWAEARYPGKRVWARLDRPDPILQTYIVSPAVLCRYGIPGVRSAVGPDQGSFVGGYARTPGLP
ncbi:ATP-binding protein [Nonomuraea sp. NBC_01738]|uniref:ATP-binding protein n=1 Tax=Nonomuraea sp. NBC_01738 TaxID=2976003 RepID=UPI002E0DCF0F|nr:ATP-binding protein [Nonomuraea sp. NBC_01738]